MTRHTLFWLAAFLITGCAGSGNVPDDDAGSTGDGDSGDGDSGDGDGDGGSCTVGSEGCACTPGGGCDPLLSCLSALCVDPADDADGGPGGDGDTGGIGGGDGDGDGNGDGDGDGDGEPPPPTYGDCSSSSDCPGDETCASVGGGGGGFPIGNRYFCSEPCDNDQDCSPPSSGNASSGCSSSGFPGTSRCELDCGGNANCPDGMDCVANGFASVCVW